MMYLTTLLKGRKDEVELDRWEEVERWRERSERETVEVNNVLNLTPQTPRVPVVVRQGGWEGGGRKRRERWQDLRMEIVRGGEEALCFSVSINVRVVKCVQGRQGGRGTGRAPYKRE